MGPRAARNGGTAGRRTARLLEGGTLIAGFTTALAIGACCVPASSLGYVDPDVKLGTTTEYLPDSTGLVAENSPRAISGMTLSSADQAALASEWDASSALDPATAAELHAEVDSILAETSTWDWELAPLLTVGTGAFWAGWQIGSEIYGVFFGDSSPQAGGAYAADRWSMAAPGTMVLSTGTGNTYAPSWGLVGTSQFTIGRATDTGACQLELYGDGTRLYEPGWVQASFCGISQYRRYVLFKQADPAQCGVVVTCSGISTVSYSGSNQPTAPTASQLQTRVAAELGTSDYPVLNRFINYLAEPLLYPDPRITEEENDHRCDRSSGPAYENPGGNVDPDPFDPHISGAFTVTNRPSSGQGVDVYLREGTSEWGPTNSPEQTPWYLDDWSGWGYRHIAAKHGWSAQDLEETEEALAAAEPEEQPSGNFLYQLPVANGSGGVSCLRNVVVDFEAGTGDPAPRGIVTSFNSVAQ